MEQLAAQLVADSIEFELPDFIDRGVPIAEGKNLASVLVGMRRVGKSWRLFQKMQELYGKGVPRERILYLNVEDERLGDVDARLLRAVEQAYFRRFPEHRSGTVYFLFDEIQHVEGWERYVRRLLDRQHIKIYLTGSSSRLLSREIATAMRGRALETILFPYSFHEFLRWRGVNIPAHLDAVSQKTRSRMEHEFEAYLGLGGFPGAVGLADFERRQLLQSYVNTVIFRDVVERYGVTGISVLRYLIRRLLGRF